MGRNKIVDNSASVEKKTEVQIIFDNLDGLVQEIRNPIANTLGLHLSCTNPSICP